MQRHLALTADEHCLLVRLLQKGAVAAVAALVLARGIQLRALDPVVHAVEPVPRRPGQQHG